MTVAELLQAAKILPANEREALCAQLAESLEPTLTPDEQAWVGVAEDRAGELRDGRVTAVPADVVFAKAAKRLSR